MTKNIPIKTGLMSEIIFVLIMVYRVHQLKTALVIIFNDHHISDENGATKISRFPRIKAVHIMNKSCFLIPINKAEIESIKLYHKRTYGVVELQPTKKGFIYANKNENISNWRDL